MEAELPHRICAIARRMAALKIARRNSIDRLWHARAEKQRRLGFGVGDPPSTPSSRATRSDSTPGLTDEAEGSLSAGVVGDVEAELWEGGGGGGDGDGADRVGTLLVRLGQLHGVGVVGVLSLAPKAVATLMLEESSASIEEMNMETNATKVSKPFPLSLLTRSTARAFFILCINSSSYHFFAEPMMTDGPHYLLRVRRGSLPIGCYIISYHMTVYNTPPGIKND